MHSALLIADYIIAKGKGKFTPRQVLKIAYIAHGFTLALLDKPLIRDRVEAWKYGPVIPAIYHTLKIHRSERIPKLYYCATNLDVPDIRERMNFISNLLDDEERAIIDRVVDVYGDFTADQLSNLTHENGTPWQQCYVPNQLWTSIPNDVTKEYYRTQIHSSDR